MSATTSDCAEIGPSDGWRNVKELSCDNTQRRTANRSIKVRYLRKASDRWDSSVRQAILPSKVESTLPYDELTCRCTYEYFTFYLNCSITQCPGCSKERCICQYSNVICALARDLLATHHAAAFLELVVTCNPEGIFAYRKHILGTSERYSPSVLLTFTLPPICQWKQCVKYFMRASLTAIK